MSIVRSNLMTVPGYMPYCGAVHCRLHWPRTTLDGKQFVCRCGWRSSYPNDFIAEYKQRWDLREVKD